ncbi:hypothetical protein Q9189_001045 [Teloschistes chrysophthalmus]
MGVHKSSSSYDHENPIFYVNAGIEILLIRKWVLLLTLTAPHVGHLYTLVLTDVFKRYHALKGKKAILCTGTDEHGMKIQRAAQKAGQEVRAFCNENYQSFEVLAKRADIQYDHFIRTSDPDHRFAVQHFWLMLKERGYIYTSKHEGWYSVSDETFYPPSSVHLTLDPATGRKYMASQETGKEVEWTSEKNYHFRLSTFRDRLLDFYAKNPEFVQPSTRMQDVVQQVTAGLSDLSISRPVGRLSWGIPVPNDTSQTIYVWLDALINYLTKANYPFQIPGQEDAAGWPADVHVIGKDIVRFHCIYWPAFLLALDLPLPKQILTHAHWTLGREKMAKSTGNVVNPFMALDRFGSDVMRYYLVRDGGIRDDSNYDNAFIFQRYRDIQGTCGNLVSRVVRGKDWNVRRAVEAGIMDTDSQGELHRAALENLPATVEYWMSQLQPGAAMKEILQMLDQVWAANLFSTFMFFLNFLFAPSNWKARIAHPSKQTNQYINNAAPWCRKDKHGRHKPLVHVPLPLPSPFPLPATPTTPTTHSTHGKPDSIIYLCAETIRICCILLQPVIPGRMKHALDLLGVEEGRRMFADAVVGGDRTYGVPMVEVGRGAEETVFPPLRSAF